MEVTKVEGLGKHGKEVCMTDAEARRMREELIHRRWPPTSGLDRAWRSIVGGAESADAKAVCLAVEMLALTVYAPDELTNFLEGLPE